MDPQIFVIFGASGDLTQRKLIPAIYELYKVHLLPEHFALLGVSRTEMSDDAFRREVFFDNPHIEGAKDEGFSRYLFYQPIDTMQQEAYKKVRARLAKLDEERQTEGNYVFYLSTPPSLYPKIPAFLANEGLNNSNKGWKRLVIEKPFGYSRESARQLNQELLQYFGEDQIFRIDHYLGKETVQNLLVTRFANGIYEPLWNRNYIHHIEVTAAEEIGVEKRGGYYDRSGALRDMVQNHLLQVVALLAMEPPAGADADSLRDEKVKLLRQVRTIE
ncbi:MAG: glucose-6-phosphate dehydrogenase (NADP(+)), partial [Phaeodactylibacter sp.]|nr:glucose-6-phosphate dehydrogenase (NADP(+)) [Phaeodactylibacter sp.]